MRLTLVMSIVLAVAYTAEGADTDKTLVSWVRLKNRALRAGSVLTIQCGPQFDGIIFGELVPDRWMAGSDYWQRTQRAQEHYPVETTDGKALVQIAIVYEGDQVSIYRNGEAYSSHKARNIDLLGGKNSFVVFGLRHIGGNGSISGAIDDARVYAKALTVEELKALVPNKKSPIEPYAWWHFEDDTMADQQQRFSETRLNGNAKVTNGALVLGANGSMVARRPYEAEKPVWPEEPPANWMTYHLCHPGPGEGMPGDPNPTFHWKGRYHLHYIYKNDTGFVFAHVSSTDLVHWKWHPTVLCPPTTGHGMFSGTGFFTKEGKPAMIYHGQGSDRNWIAYGLDDNLDKWSKPEAVLPKTEDGKDADIRHWDPDCWLNGDTYYAIAGGENANLMKSYDLKTWKHLGLLLHKDYPDNLGVSRTEDISCANMFKIGNKWMLLCISHRLGCRYFLGDFKDEKYLPDFHAMMSWNGNNYFAPETMLTEDGRRIMWAWILNLPIAPTAVQGLPRELELPGDGVLRMRPLRELETLRHDGKSEQDFEVADGKPHQLRAVGCDTYELELAFELTVAKRYGVDVLCDANGEGGLRIAVVGEKKTLQVGRVEVPFVLKEGEELRLRVFVDKNLVEVFANDRQAAVAATDKYNPAMVHARLFAEGGDVQVEKTTVWKVKPIFGK